MRQAEKDTGCRRVRFRAYPTPDTELVKIVFWGKPTDIVPKPQQVSEVGSL